MGATAGFHSIYRHGLAAVAACTTRCTLADPSANVAAILDVARDCDKRGVALAVFPELGVSGYAISDLLHQTTLLDAVEAAIANIVAAPQNYCRCCWSARRYATPAHSTTARWRSIAAACSAWCPRSICPTTANSMSRDIS